MAAVTLAVGVLMGGDVGATARTVALVVLSALAVVCYLQARGMIVDPGDERAMLATLGRIVVSMLAVVGYRTLRWLMGGGA